MEKYWILLVLLHVAGIIQIGRSQDQCDVKFLTEDSTVFVPFGGHVTVNCSYTCDKPAVKTRLLKSNETNGPNWVSHLVLVDDWEKSGAACIHTYDDGETKLSNITIMAYALPSHVTIDLQGELEEGTAHSITCTAYDVAPVSVLTISVTRGGDEIYSKAIDGDLTKGPTTVTEIYNFTASRSDNLQDFTCQATLQLGTVPNTTVQSPSITVRTYALPEDPSIDVNKWIKYGTSAIAECRVHNVFPLQNVTLQLSIGDNLLDLETIIGSDSATGSVTLTNSTYNPRWNKVTCISQVFHLSRNITKDVYFYDFSEISKVHIVLSNHTVYLGSMVTADCWIDNHDPDVYCMAISVNGQRMLEVCSSELSYNVTATTRHPEIGVTCTVYIRDDPTISETATETIAVHYPPENSSLILSPDRKINIGESFNLTCQADASPPPVYTWEIHSEDHVTYSPDNNSITISKALSSHNGTYKCEVNNKHGSSKAQKNVVIEEDGMWKWIVVAVVAGIVVVALVAFISMLCKKKGKKGFYSLLTGSKNRKSENGLNKQQAPQKTTPV